MSPREYKDFCEETKEWNRAHFSISANIPTLDLDDRLRRVEKRLLLIAPPEEYLAKYPALREAYDHYKLIESLIEGK